ncbi:MAG: Type IV pilus biogenesis and competence protein PilQ precursor [Syntrophorhabdus sp. PtaU1.Bin153]|nr:MAG: Type IV pilus biogenesis and competence protein PilQ precursor [Syntrophorhabdus sp. PtaU1.Bin153]
MTTRKNIVRDRVKRLFVFVWLFLLSSACTNVTPLVKPESPETLKPLNIQSPLVPQVEKEKRMDPEASGERFSFSLKEADVKDVLRGLSKQTNYNVVIEPDVKGTCTVDLKDVTLAKALEYILEPLNYTFRIEDRTIYVSRPKIETRIFSLNYVALRKIGTSSVVGSMGGSYSTATTGGGEIKSVEIKTETEADIWKNVEENIKTMLSKEGKVVVNKQALMVFVTDYPKELKHVAAYLDAVEGTLHKQVMIEAKIIEVQLNDTSRQGVNWQFVEGKIGEFIVNAKQTLLNPFILEPTQTLRTTTPTASIPYFRFFVGNKHLNIDNTFIDLLETQGKINVVSNPKIATLNNQRAVIKVAKQDVYFEEQQSTTGTTNILATYTPRFITVGLVLDVTPQIDGSGNIILNIHPMLTEKVDVATSPNGAEVPILDVREADTVVRVKEGETVIIGGLIKDRKSTADKGTKGLMHLPLIGWFFRLSEEETLRNELVVVLTPRIVYSGNAS